MQGFPAGLVVRIPDFHCHGLDSISGQGNCGEQMEKNKKLQNPNANPQTFPDVEEILGTFHNSVCETSMITPKPNKDTTKKLQTKIPYEH